MLVSEAIDQIAQYTDNVVSSGADYDDRRKRILFWVREEVAQTYYAREWTFRMKITDGSATPHISIPANQGYGQLPSDFLSPGKLGRFYNKTGGGYPLHPAAESEIVDLIALEKDISSPSRFTIYGTDGGTPPRKLIWIGKVATAVELRAFYHKKMPELDDSTAHGGDDTKDANLDQTIPEEYQQTVIIPGLRMRARRSKGDDRWQADEKERLEGLAEMIRNNRRFQAGEQRLTSFFGD